MPATRTFESLDESEILALAIAQEEEDERIYANFAAGLRAEYPASAAVFDAMREEESEHRRRLIELFRLQYGEHIPLIRRGDVRGVLQRKPVWLTHPLRLRVARDEAARMEAVSRDFYLKAASRASNPGVRRLLGDLAQEENSHHERAAVLTEGIVHSAAEAHEAAATRRRFLLQIVQPGLVGLMDGSVSTLAPVFAAAVATHNTSDAFRVGLAASVGAGISMGFAEALSDDGQLTGRGLPWIRGLVCGAMTAVGGIGHTLPFLIANFHTAFTAAIFVVLVELGIITWIRHRYMESPPVAAALQICLGGALVFGAGLLIGSS